MITIVDLKAVYDQAVEKIEDLFARLSNPPTHYPPRYQNNTSANGDSKQGFDELEDEYLNAGFFLFCFVLVWFVLVCFSFVLVLFWFVLFCFDSRLTSVPNITHDTAEFKSEIGQEGYESAVKSLIEHIKRGDIFQAVPSQRVARPLHNIGAFDMYRALRLVNPSPYMFYFDLGGFEVGRHCSINLSD